MTGIDGEPGNGSERYLRSKKRLPCGSLFDRTAYCGRRMMLLLVPARPLRFFEPRFAVFFALPVFRPVLRGATLRPAFLATRFLVAFFLPAFLELFFRVAMG